VKKSKAEKGRTKLTQVAVEKVTFLGTLPYKFAPKLSELGRWQKFFDVLSPDETNHPVKKVKRKTKGLVDNSRMTRRNNRCESSHRILIAAEKEAAFIHSVSVNFRSYVVRPFEFRSVQTVQNKKN
jgi:hypothetical protein